MKNPNIDSRRPLDASPQGCVQGRAGRAQGSPLARAPEASPADGPGARASALAKTALDWRAPKGTRVPGLSLLTSCPALAFSVTELEREKVLTCHVGKPIRSRFFGGLIFFLNFQENQGIPKNDSKCHFFGGIEQNLRPCG